MFGEALAVIRRSYRKNNFHQVIRSRSEAHTEQHLQVETGRASSDYLLLGQARVYILHSEESIVSEEWSTAFKMAKKFGSPDGTPNPVLVALISQFLSNHGFESTLRVWNTEKKSRSGSKQKDASSDIFGKKLTKDLPQLDVMLKEYMAKVKVDANDSSSSNSEEADSSSDSDVEMADDAKSEASSSSSSDSSSSADSSSDSSESESDSGSGSGSDSAASDVKKPAIAKSLKRKASSSSSSSSGSDSSSDSETEARSNRPLKKSKTQHKKSESESSSDSDSSSSSSDSEDSDDESAAKQLREAAATALPDSDSSSSSSSSSESGSSSDSDSSSSDDDVASSSSSSSDDEDDDAKADDEPIANDGINATKTLDRASSDSSATIQGDPAPLPPWPVKDEKKRSGARPTRLAELSAQAQDGEYLSNQYISYDYADRAYNDLVVTRGKGFTKEKNKKKRGSYRGGPIDTSGGKAFKFED